MLHDCVEDQGRAYREIRRVLKPGARALIYQMFARLTKMIRHYGLAKCAAALRQYIPDFLWQLSGRGPESPA